MDGNIVFPAEFEASEFGLAAFVNVPCTLPVNGEVGLAVTVEIRGSRRRVGESHYEGLHLPGPAIKHEPCSRSVNRKVGLAVARVIGRDQKVVAGDAVVPYEPVAGAAVDYVPTAV